MSGDTLILVHGMGDHTEESFKKQVVETLNSALKRYDSYKNVNIEDSVNIVPISYNDVFEERREEMADTSKDIGDRLSQQVGFELLNKLISFEKDLAKDEFFYTHWLDVIFYKSLIGGHVRVKVAKKITEVLSQEASTNVHVLGHSLGTAVVHDTLSYLYENKFDPDDGVQALHRDTHRLNSIWMVANVGQALFSKVDQSVVKPGPDGCCMDFYETRHALDPITWVKPFNPIQDGAWIANDYWRQYHFIQTSAMTYPNPHSIEQYLADPFVHVKLLNRIIDFEPDEYELKKAEESFYNETLRGSAQEFKEKITEFTPTDTDSIKDLIRAGNKLVSIVKEFQKEFKL